MRETSNCIRTLRIQSGQRYRRRIQIIIDLDLIKLPNGIRHHTIWIVVRYIVEAEHRQKGRFNSFGVRMTRKR